MARRRGRARRFYGRMRHHRFHKPKLLTKAITVGGLLIAFNPEIGSLSNSFQSGEIFRDPQNAFRQLAYNSVGIDGQGNLDTSKLVASLTSKVGGYAFVKVAKWFVRHMGRI